MNVFHEAIENYRQNIEKIIEIGTKCYKKESTKTKRDSLNQSLGDLEEDSLQNQETHRVVLLCGKLKCGKTSFLNELLNYPTVEFPYEEEPVTGIFVRVTYSDTDYWSLYRVSEVKSGHRSEFQRELIDQGDNLDSIEEQINVPRIKRSRREYYSRILVVGLASKILKCGLDLIDTPGLGENSDLERFVLSYIPHLRPNLIVYLFDSKPKFDRIDRRHLLLLQERLSEFEHSSAEAMQYLIVATKVDVDEESARRDNSTPTPYDPDEMENLLKYHFKCDSDRFLPVHPVSVNTINEIRAMKSENKYKETEHYKIHEIYFNNILLKITSKLRRLKIHEYLSSCRNMETTIRLMVCGKTSSGKSSFITSLLGGRKSIELPSSEEAATKIFLKIKYNDTPLLEIIEFDAHGKESIRDRAKDFDISTMNEIVYSGKEKVWKSCTMQENILYQLSYPLTFLGHHVEIIDSPGFTGGAADEGKYKMMKRLVPHIVMYLFDSRRGMDKSDAIIVKQLKEQFKSADPIRSSCMQWILVASKVDTCDSEDNNYNYSGDIPPDKFNYEQAKTNVTKLFHETPQCTSDLLPILTFSSKLSTEDETYATQFYQFYQSLHLKLNTFIRQLASNFAYWGIHILDLYGEKVDQDWIDYWYEMKMLSVDEAFIQLVKNDLPESIIDYQDAFKVYFFLHEIHKTKMYLFITELCEESSRKINFQKEKENIYAHQWRTLNDVVFMINCDDLHKIYVIHSRPNGNTTFARLLPKLRESSDINLSKICEQILELYDNPRIYKQFRPDLLFIDSHDNILHEFDVPNHPELPLILADDRTAPPFHLHPSSREHYPHLPHRYRLYRLGWCLWIVLNRGSSSPSEVDKSSMLSRDECIYQIIRTCGSCCRPDQMDDRNFDDVWSQIEKLRRELRK